MNYFLHLLIYFDIYLILAWGLNLLVGYSRLLSLAHASFFAAGAYAYGLASLFLGWDSIGSLILACLVAGFLGVALALVSWRVRGDVFVLASLAVGFLIHGIFYNWFESGSPVGTWKNLTIGPFGLSGIPRPRLFAFDFVSIPQVSGLATLLAFGFGVVIWKLLRSPWGRALQAIREDEVAARSLGKPVRRLRFEAVLVATISAGGAGAIYASYVGFVDPSAASLDNSILLLSMVIVGGVGNFIGPAVGAAVLVALPEVLRSLALPDPVAAEVRLLLYGLFLVLVVHLRPNGIAGRYRLE